MLAAPHTTTPGAERASTSRRRQQTTPSADGFAGRRRGRAHLRHERAAWNSGMTEHADWIAVAGSTDVDRMLGLPEATSSVVVSRTKYAKGGSWPAGPTRIPKPSGIVGGRAVWLLVDVEIFARKNKIKLNKEVRDEVRERQSLPGPIEDVVSLTDLSRSARYEKSGGSITPKNLELELLRAGVPVVAVAGIGATSRSLALACTIRSARSGLLVWDAELEPPADTTTTAP
jgi:hypothetical protein